MREYQFVSPSLDGIIWHDSIVYEGIRRPEPLRRLMDRRGASQVDLDPSEQQTLEGYFNDLYVVFMKKLSCFVTATDPDQDEGLKLQALLQEMVKVKRMCARGASSHVTV